MPTYEYRCPKGHEFDLFQRMSDEPGATCPVCAEPAERLMSGGAGLIFKGDGFYITDYRSDAYKKAASSDKEASGSKGDSAGKSSGGAGSSDSGGSAERGGSSEGGGSSNGGPSKSKEASSGSSGTVKPSDVGKSSSSDS